jgi:predicted pyridoxine 5'-phosphate oxidase superfamily flavin-nucleotide-binding protein
MRVALLITVDEDLEAPLYGDPPLDELPEGVASRLSELATDIFDGEVARRGATVVDEHRIAWKMTPRVGVLFLCAVTAEVEEQDLKAYLDELTELYMDEVDDPRNPERDGLEDLLVDVIPPWEDE